MITSGDAGYNMMRMWNGALGVAPENCLVSPAYVVLAPQNDVVFKFFEYLFKRPALLILLIATHEGLQKTACVYTTTIFPVSLCDTRDVKSNNASLTASPSSPLRSPPKPQSSPL